MTERTGHNRSEHAIAAYAPCQKLGYCDKPAGHPGECEGAYTYPDSAASLDRCAFTVYGLAAPAGSKTTGARKDGARFVRDSSKRAAPWKLQVADAAGKAMDGAPLMDGPLALLVYFHVPRPKGHSGARGLRPSAPTFPITRPDTTKLLRALEDAMTGIVWRDDSQVVAQWAWKLYGEPARAEVEVRAL